MSDFAAFAPAFYAALIGAVGAVASALILGWVAFRAQSAKEQLDAFEKLLSKYLGEAVDRILDHMHTDMRETLDARSRGVIIGELVKRAVREVLSEGPGFRRWYDQPPSDDE